MRLNLLAFNCTLKSSPEQSSTDKLLRQACDAFAEHEVSTEIVRAADFNIKPGVQSDEGEGDDWPALRQKVMAADILMLGTPIWLGQPSSIAKRLLERMDAFLGEKDDRKRTPGFSKVAVVAVVGNEDGAHHVHAELFQALNEVGFTVPAQGSTYWVGEAMETKDYKDLTTTPETTDSATRLMAASAAHLARLLKQQSYPGLGN